MENPHENSPQNNPPLSLQEKALAYGMLYQKKNVLTDYSFDKKGVKILQHANLGKDGLKTLVDKFRFDPKDCLAMARENLFSIMKDPRLSHEEKTERLSRYLDAYFELQIYLDRQAFPPSDKVFQKVPAYVPDGLSDMGSEPSAEPDFRSREKLRVNKHKVLVQSKDLFISVFSHDFSNIPNEERSGATKKYIADQVGLYVYHVLPYDYHGQAVYEKGHSVPIANFRETQLAVCRQQALYTQILLQAFGLTSRLVKTDISFNNGVAGAHANNLVRINNKWFVLDVTNPEKINPQRSVVFMKPIKEDYIDLNNNKYSWTFANGYETRSYTTRNNMHYRIRDNAKDPLD